MRHTTGLGISLVILLLLAVMGGCSQEHSNSIGVEGSQTYKLVGIIKGDPEAAGAVFEDVQTKKQKLYRVGEVIEGATVIEIKRQQVLLKWGEEIKVVHLTQGSPGDEMNAKVERPYNKRVSGEPIPVPAGLGNPRQARKHVLSQVVPPYDQNVGKTAISRPELNRFIADLGERLAEETVFVATSMGPALDLAHMDGDMLHSLGLAPTDLIVGISGMGLDSPERLYQIFGILGRAKVLNFSVLRGEVVQPLYYEVHLDM